MTGDAARAQSCDRGGQRALPEVSSSAQWCSAVHPTRLPHDTRREARGGGGGAAPSVATAGGPRLERRCAPQPRAPSEQDAHTRWPPARTAILALEPSHLIPIYLARRRSLKVLYDRKRVFTPRSRYVDSTSRDREAACSLLSWLFRCYVTIERAYCLTVNVQPCTHSVDYSVQFGYNEIRVTHEIGQFIVASKYGRRRAGSRNVV